MLITITHGHVFSLCGKIPAWSNIYAWSKPCLMSMSKQSLRSDFIQNIQTPHVHFLWLDRHVARQQVTPLLDIIYTHLMVEQHRAAWLQGVFVNKWQDADIMFTANRCWHDGVVVINDLLQCANWHGRPTQVIDLWPLLLLVNKTSNCQLCMFVYPSLRRGGGGRCYQVDSNPVPYAKFTNVIATLSFNLFLVTKQIYINKHQLCVKAQTSGLQVLDLHSE